MDVVTISAGAALGLVARLGLGAFFLQAAIGKLGNLRSFSHGIVEYHVLPTPVARVAGVLLPWGELGLAVALLLGLAAQVAAAAAALLLMCFIGAVAINLRRGHVIACNCYGIADTSTIGRGTIARNAFLLLFAGAALGDGPRIDGPAWWHPRGSADWLLLSPSTALLLFLLLVGSVVGIVLLEWTIDMYDRVSQLRAA